MGTETKIAWTDHTFNVWWGCQRVSPGCEHCYAESFDKRVGGTHWGPAKTTERRTFGTAYWEKPLKWDRDALRDSVRPRRRVFCSSMADVFEDHPVAHRERARLWRTIRCTPNLDWQLLTKRPENILPFITQDACNGTLWFGDKSTPDWLEDWARGKPPKNVWLGASVENQEYADKRVPILLAVPAAVRFLSIEPMLGKVLIDNRCPNCLNGLLPPFGYEKCQACTGCMTGIHWGIVGCESGPKRRPFDTEAAIETVRQFGSASVPCFVKQVIVAGQVCHDIERFPAELQVQQFPAIQVAL